MCLFIKSFYTVLRNRFIRAGHQGLVTAYSEGKIGLSSLGNKFVHTAAGKQCQQP